MSNQVREAYETIQMPEEAKRRIYDGIMQTQGKSVAKIFPMQKIVKVAVFIVCALVCSGTAYATYRWLNASEAVSEMGEKTLAEKFAKKDSEVQIQEDGNYRAIYLGEMSGKILLENEVEAKEERTYFVMAVERTDEKKISLEEEIVISPFVKGYAPWQFNIYHMSGVEQAQLIDNVLYHIVECDTMEIFAEQGVYLGVVDRAPSAKSYQFNEDTGEITSATEYKGLNMIFKLELDRSKANPKKAEEYLREAGVLEVESEVANTSDEERPWYEVEKIDELLSQCVMVEGSEQNMNVQTIKQYGQEYERIEYEHDDFGVFAGTAPRFPRVARLFWDEDKDELEWVLLMEKRQNEYFGTLYRPK